MMMARIALILFYGSQLIFEPNANAGPAENYSDSCKYEYDDPKRIKPQGDDINNLLKALYANALNPALGTARCVTKRGRVLDHLGNQIGSLGKDFIVYDPPTEVWDGPVYVGRTKGTYYTRKFVQTSNGTTLTEYKCESSSKGACLGPSSKYLLQYEGTK